MLFSIPVPQVHSKPSRPNAAQAKTCAHSAGSSQLGARHILSGFSGIKISRPEELEEGFAGNWQFNGQYSWRAA